MKNTILVLFILSLSLPLFAQDYTNLADIKFLKPSDYKDNETKVEECSNYILGQKYKSNELTKLKCMQFIMKWMAGTPDYSFSLGSDFSSLCNKDTELVTLYMASLVKAALNDDYSGKDSKSITKNGHEIFLKYCASPENNVKMHKALKKAVKK